MAVLSATRHARRRIVAVALAGSAATIIGAALLPASVVTTTAASISYGALKGNGATSPSRTSGGSGTRACTAQTRCARG
jgi:hypothetical protein